MDLGPNFLNSLVYGWLSTAAPELATEFKKETNVEALPPGMPQLNEMVEHYKAISGCKRKAEVITNGSAKIAKKVRLKINIS